MPSKATAAAAPSAPTLDHARRVIERTRLEIDNHGAGTCTGQAFKDAYDLLAWLVQDYFLPEDE
jgi:hypothetical protein